MSATNPTPLRGKISSVHESVVVLDEFAVIPRRRGPAITDLMVVAKQGGSCLSNHPCQWAKWLTQAS
jgi:hypothetical protein